MHPYVAWLYPQHHQPQRHRKPRHGNVLQRDIQPQPPRHFLRESLSHTEKYIKGHTESTDTTDRDSYEYLFQMMSRFSLEVS